VTTDGYSRALTFGAAVGAAVVAGVFFAFSTFVMPALRRLPNAQGLAAMQAINKAAPSSAFFMTALFGTAVLCVLLALSAVTRLDQTTAVYQLAGCLLYLLCVVVTIVYHVPRNNALAHLDASSAAAGGTWRHYLTGWTAWNHVRTLLPLAGSVAFVVALRRR
jgi:uncharacterized membrane protein